MTSEPMSKLKFCNKKVINFQGISFDDDSDEDADWKRKDLKETEVSCFDLI